MMNAYFTSNSCSLRFTEPEELRLHLIPLLWGNCDWLDQASKYPKASNLYWDPHIFFSIYIFPFMLLPIFPSLEEENVFIKLYESVDFLWITINSRLLVSWQTFTLELEGEWYRNIPCCWTLSISHRNSKSVLLWLLWDAY